MLLLILRCARVQRPIECRTIITARAHRRVVCTPLRNPPMPNNTP
jgi:hypothetical protein